MTPFLCHFDPAVLRGEIHPIVISNAVRNPHKYIVDFSSFHSSKWHPSFVISNLFHFLTPGVTRDYWWNIAPLRGAPRWNRGEGVNPRHRKRSPSPSGRNFLPNILLQERSQGIFFWISRRFTPRNDITVISNAVRNPFPLCFLDFSSFHSSKWHLSLIISILKSKKMGIFHPIIQHYQNFYA